MPSDTSLSRIETAPRARGLWGDRLFRWLTLGVAILVLAIMAAIGVTLGIDSIPVFRKMGLAYFTSTQWNPVTGEFGIVPQVVGTLVTALIAMIIGVPVSFGVSLFVTQMAPRWLKRPVAQAIELLAGIPSIIYGMWGLFVLAPVLAASVEPWLNDHLGPWPLVGAVFSGPPLGIGVLPAGLILGIMVIPFIASVTIDVFDSVPPVQKESAYALGATTWEVSWRVILPYSRTAVLGAFMLGLGRALGETMAVTFIIGNANDLHASLLLPGNTISSVIANEFTEATSDVHLSALIAAGLVLFVITFFVLAAAQLMLRRMAARAGSRA